MTAPFGFARVIVRAAERVRPGAAAVLEDMPPAALARIAAMAARGVARAPLLGAAGPSLLVGRRVTIRDPRRVFVGRGVIIEDGVEIQGRSRRGISLGDGVTVRNGAMMRPVQLLRPRTRRGLRHRSGQQRRRPVLPGMRRLHRDRSRRAHGFHGAADRGGARARRRSTIKAAGTTRRGIRIGDGCWLGAGSIVLDGVELGAGCVVGAGAVVTRSWPAGSVLAGVPATLLREPAAGEGQTEPRRRSREPDD